MATLYTFGLQEILFNGTKVGEVYKDTCKITQDGAEVTEHFEEGKPNPAIRNKKSGPMRLEFAIMNPDAQFLKTHLGGTYDSATKTWKFGLDTTPVVEGEWEVKPKKGFSGIKINRGDAEATIDFEISDAGLLLVRFVVTPLTPTDGTTAPVEFVEPA